MKPINSLDLPEPTKDELLALITELERQAASDIERIRQEIRDAVGRQHGPSEFRHAE